MQLKRDTLHEIGNYLHQIIGSAEHISQSTEMFEYAQKIKSAAYSIDALITDVTVQKLQIDISKSSEKLLDLKKFSGLNVLIVDDVVENIDIMKNIFHTLSCNIASAQSGEEALEVYKSGFVPAIVCMDMVMPGIDGSVTTKELKNLGCNAYFIAISALKNQPNSVVSLFDCWLPKPFTLEHINRALSGYSTSSVKRVVSASYMITDAISAELKEEILSLAKDGAYSELDRVFKTLPDSTNKEFLTTSLKKIDFQSIIKSIVSS